MARRIEGIAQPGDAASIMSRGCNHIDTGLRLTQRQRQSTPTVSYITIRSTYRSPSCP
jgi:hypothetical protein